jgi:tetratricopeptide (TPR) repeat protein
MQRHARHDHGFTIPDPLLTKEQGIPNACNRCHADKTADWALAVTEKWYGDKMNRPTRARAEIMAKAHNGELAAPDPLLGLLATNETDYWKAVSAGFLEPWAVQPVVRDALLRQLHSPSALVRESAVRALQPAVEANEPAVADALNSSLSDPVLSVRIATAWVLRQTLATNTPVAGELRQFLNLHADQPAGQAQIGAFDLARGDLDAAVTHYARAIRWDFNSAPLHHDLAIVLSLQGKNREAVQELETACRLAPQAADYEFKLGLAWASVEDLGQATAALEKATEIDPRHARAWYNLGLIYQSLGRNTDALNALQRAEAMAANDPDIPYARATILARLGHILEARSAARRALEINPNYSSAASLLDALPAP